MRAAPIAVLTIGVSTAAVRAGAQTFQFRPVTLDIAVAGTTASNPQDLNNRGPVRRNRPPRGLLEALGTRAW